MQDHSLDIIAEIKTRGAEPRPRWHFLAWRALFWFLSTASVAVGGIAFSVAWYVFFDNDGLHVSFSNILQVIPYVWLLVLGVFVVCAYFGFRHTKKGYRYPAALVLPLLIAASIGVALALDSYDVGQTVHKYLLSHTDFYDALIYSSDDEAD